MYRNKKIIAQARASWADWLQPPRPRRPAMSLVQTWSAVSSSPQLTQRIGGKLMTRVGILPLMMHYGVAWVKLLRSFARRRPAEYYTDNDVNLFKAGKAGIIIDGTWNMTAWLRPLARITWPLIPGRPTARVTCPATCRPKTSTSARTPALMT